MTALIVIGCIAASLFLIGLIPVGADAAFDGNGFRLGVRVGVFSIRLGGEKKSREKASDKKKEKPKDKKKKKLPSPSLILSLLKNGYALLCRLIAGLRVDVLRLHFTSGFEDPSLTAMAYAAAGTAMDGLMRVGRGRVRLTDLKADVDFDRTAPLIDFHILVHITIGRVAGAALRFGAGLLRDLMCEKRKERKDGKSSDRRDHGKRNGQDPGDGGLEHGGGRTDRDA